MLAEIITIGDEILIGQIVDTNSAWIATTLNDHGIRVKQITSVSDSKDHILEALEAASQRAELIIITGGLGPTKDDITKKTMAEYFGVGFRRDEEALENVKRIFTRSNRPVLAINEQQADVPQNAVVLQNQNGTAPGMWFEAGKQVYVSLPGVPFEMKYLIEEEVLPRVKSHFKLSAIVHHTILTAGLGESFLAEAIADIEDSLPAYIHLAYLPKLGQVRLRLSAYGLEGDTLSTEIQKHVAEIIARIPEYVIVSEDIPLEVAAMNLLEEKNLTLTVAESCTGGFLSHLFTQHSGASSVFLGGAVTYSNELKERLLNVQHSTLQSFGAVSEETVVEMANGACRNFNSDYAIAISGVAGPGGGTEAKPVGTVWVAVSGKTKTITHKYSFSGRRTQNIERAAINSIVLLLKLVKEEHN
ncbi:nicotinamide-nucleotide amidase [Arcticibacter pallidicorallinus]|uniref:CinA-like protein n=1 Tax=Arcticibacter pallidicorallinus TaxID=1259464 RepID=A0A2T0U3A7_9SPHI|nr:competence/damage-inducible protein A [Arcticibacter pallidicorallinus]PRY52391.1 nicotinamide-nucleotide amidase [Arcticibacter pallidicorallinus]